MVSSTSNLCFSPSGKRAEKVIGKNGKSITEHFKNNGDATAAATAAAAAAASGSRNQTNVNTKRANGSTSNKTGTPNSNKTAKVNNNNRVVTATGKNKTNTSAKAKGLVKAGGKWSPFNNVKSPTAENSTQTPPIVGGNKLGRRKITTSGLHGSSSGQSHKTPAATAGAKKAVTSPAKQVQLANGRIGIVFSDSSDDDSEYKTPQTYPDTPDNVRYAACSSDEDYIDADCSAVLDAFEASLDTHSGSSGVGDVSSGAGDSPLLRSAEVPKLRFLAPLRRPRVELSKVAPMFCEPPSEAKVRKLSAFDELLVRDII